MIKYIINKLNLFVISIIFSSELFSLEILEVKMMDSYKITREFPGKLLPAQQSNLAFESFLKPSVATDAYNVSFVSK